MRFSLDEVAGAMGAVWPADAAGPAATRMAEGWSVDSRTVAPGDVFFALRGPNFDGHAYVAEALRKGAAAAVVDQRAVDGEAGLDGTGGGLLLRVADSLESLQRLAAWARTKWGGSVVAVTGSAGKTTTKDVVAEMLSVGMTTARSEGNFNNHVGLPLSLLRLDESARAAVLELGMNHAGEIRQLASIARPDVAVVTNVGPAHIENFDSIEGIAAAKRELVESLDSAGTAILNADDPRVAAMAHAHRGTTILYGQSPAAQIRAEHVEQRDGMAAFRVGTVDFESRLTGRHNVSNLLAGIAVAGVYGIAPDRLREKVRTLVPGKMRGARIEHGGLVILNDCYNSNPDAARAMLDVLADTPAGRRIAVLGEMLELGRWAEPLHRDVGDYAAKRGIDVLVGIRGATCHLLDAAKRAGLQASAALFFDDPREAGRYVRSIARPGDALLFKGSRGVRVELALEELLAVGDAPKGASGDSIGGRS